MTVPTKKEVDFGWIRSPGCSLNNEGIEDRIVRSVIKISILWWCNQKNWSINRTSRQKVINRKFQVLSDQ
jgi:hypothetical protein